MQKKKEFVQTCPNQIKCECQHLKFHFLSGSPVLDRSDSSRHSHHDLSPQRWTGRSAARRCGNTNHRLHIFATESPAWPTADKVHTTPTEPKRTRHRRIVQQIVQRRNAYYDICLSKTSISAYHATTDSKHPVVVFVHASLGTLFIFRFGLNQTSAR